MIELNKLNKKQYEAVTTELGPRLIIAGAGSGKTQVLTFRFAYLIEKFAFDVDEILAITFTNKAANEMKNRLSQMLSIKTFTWVGTFHAICLKILKEEISHLNRDKNFTIVDEEDQISILKDSYKIYNIDTKNFPYKTLLSFIEKVKTNRFDKKDILNEQQWKFLNIKTKMESHWKYNIFQHYIDVCQKNNFLDFNDLLILTNDLLDIEVVKEKWAKKFKYVLVDEFQDTNDEQYNLIKKLTTYHQNIFAVGDPDQMIYTWRGANFSIINNFHIQYKNTKTIVLDINYRSSQEILDASNQLIQNNKNRFHKNLVSNTGLSNNKPIYHFAVCQDDESRWVVNKILALVNKNISLNEICILYRSNYLSRNIEQELIINNLKYTIYGGVRFYQRKEIKDVIAYLKALFLKDELSIKRIINIPRRGISQNTITIINEYALRNKLAFCEALYKIENINVSKQAQKGIKDFIDLLSSFDINKKLSELFDEILLKSDYINYLTINEEKDRISNIDELKGSIVQYQEENPHNNFIDYLQEISLYTSNEDSNDNSLSLMTIHMSKGLEFSYIFIIGLNEEVFPSRRSADTDEGLEEERRIAYVGMTRAKKQLYLSSHGGKNFISNNFNRQSRFINEINKSSMIIEKLQLKSISQNNNNDWYDSGKKINYRDNYILKKNDFKIGDRIVHTSFGEGIVIAVYNETITVSFKPPFNKKTIISNHKAIKRVSIVN